MKHVTNECSAAGGWISTTRVHHMTPQGGAEIPGQENDGQILSYGLLPLPQ